MGLGGGAESVFVRQAVSWEAALGGFWTFFSLKNFISLIKNTTTTIIMLNEENSIFNKKK